jgi:benzoyl-CoA reductase/2-hydroxyglutaryl-CoA dehydratase subunit BcrC/BadD/HgdB
MKATNASDRKVWGVLRSHFYHQKRNSCKDSYSFLICIDLLDKLCSEYKVDGVIDVILQACHTYNIETLRLKRFFDEKSLPYMSIETDYSLNY